MTISIVMNLDARSDKNIRAMWDALTRGGVSPDCLIYDPRPHVSLAEFEEARLDALMDRVRSFAENHPPVPITFDHLGTFATEVGIIFLAPVITRNLLDVHSDFHATFRDFHANSSFYQRDRWVPHCTLARNLDTDQFCRAIKVIRQFDLPFEARLESLGVIRHPPIEELGVLNLK